jgi:hypothetical protein
MGRVQAVVALLLALPAISMAGEPADSGVDGDLRLLVDAKGGLSRLSKADFEKGPRGPFEGRADAAWGDIARWLEKTLSRSPESGSLREEPPPAPPSRREKLLLRWDAEKKKCRIAAAGSSFQLDGAGISAARGALQKASKGEALDVWIDAAPDVPFQWVLAAVQMARDSKKWFLSFRVPAECLKDGDLADALRLFPLRSAPSWTGEGPSVQALVDADAPFRSAASLLLLAARNPWVPVRMGRNPAGLADFHRPGERGASTGACVDALLADAVVLRALAWLRDHQGGEGGWSCDHFMARCRRGACSGPGSTESYDAGVTALALRAFLAAGHTAARGDFRETVAGAVKWLLAAQAEDGCVGRSGPGGFWIYNHCLATQALCEALAWEGRNPELQSACRKAVRFLVDCQNPDSGWRYGVRPKESDTSCTAAAVAALKAAVIAGLEVPPTSFQGAMKWIEQATDKEWGITGYTSPGDTGALLAEAVGRFEPQPTMTAAALASRLWVQGESALWSASVMRGAKVLLDKPPLWEGERGRTCFYYWYWGTTAAFLLGPETRDRWEPSLLQALVPKQAESGCAKGSWDPVDAWGSAGGRVYATAVCALALESLFPYRRDLVLR